MLLLEPEEVARKINDQLQEYALPEAFWGASLIAHRGIHSEAPENSLSAFKEASKRGLPIELDVWLSADRELIVMHDSTTTRMTGKRAQIQNLTLAELKELALTCTGESIPTLAEVLDETPGAVLIHVKGFDVMPHLGHMLRSRPALARRVIVESFNPWALKRLALFAPDVYRCQLIGTDHLPSSLFIGAGAITRAALRISQAQIAAIQIGLLNPSIVDLLRTLGVGILGWTARSESDTEKCYKLGVPAISDVLPGDLLPEDESISLEPVAAAGGVW